MTKLVLEPTETAQWHALIHEAQGSRALALDEHLESYLVFLLMRFAARPEVASSVIAMDFLETYHSGGSLRIGQLREVADKCLLFAGLFPGQAERRCVQISYFVDLGKTAYSELSGHHEPGEAALYASLCQKFVELMDVLQAVRENGNSNASISLLQAAELWASTSSESAYQKLIETGNFPIAGDDNILH